MSGPTSTRTISECYLPDRKGLSGSPWGVTSGVLDYLKNTRQKFLPLSVCPGALPCCPVPQSPQYDRRDRGQPGFTALRVTRILFAFGQAIGLDPGLPPTPAISRRMLSFPELWVTPPPCPLLAEVWGVGAIGNAVSFWSFELW